MRVTCGTAVLRPHLDILRSLTRHYLTIHAQARTRNAHAGGSREVAERESTLLFLLAERPVYSIYDVWVWMCWPNCV